jgi:hypothetical protein
VRVAKYPQDRFDDKSAQAGRAGAHRQPISRRPWWATSLISVGVTAGLILAALAGVAVVDAKNLQDLDIPALGITATPTPTPNPEIPVVDPTLLSKKELKLITITVLNGTTSETLADEVADILKTQEWPNITTADAADSTIKISVVVYGPDEDLPLATSVAKSIGISAVKQSDMYPGAKVTIIIGRDFVR